MDRFLSPQPLKPKIFPPHHLLRTPHHPSNATDPTHQICQDDSTSFTPNDQPSTEHTAPTATVLPAIPNQPLPTASPAATAPPAATTTHPTSTAQGIARPGRRPKFTPSDDLVIIREVAAAKTHVAPNGETKERFETAATRVNATGKLSSAVTWKSVQDRYKRLQARFDREDREEALISGVGGEVGEIEELLGSMKEARDDKEREEMEKRKLVKEKEDEKERLGGIIREQALKRRGERTASKASSSSEEGENETPKKKKRLRDGLRGGFDGELRHFTEALTRGDQERNRIDEERLRLDRDRDRLETEKTEREKDRVERKEEREETQALELTTPNLGCKCGCNNCCMVLKN